MEIVNVEQAQAWDGHEGDLWTEHADRYDRASAPIRTWFNAAGVITATDDVLDIGCGTGRSTRDAARLAPDGSALGLDLSARMLELARARSKADGLDNVRFVQGDAQVHPFEPAAHDLAMSSFGAMFFNDARAAFANIGTALRPGGRLAVLAWRGLADNEWLQTLRDALAAGRDLPVPPAEGPSPFSLSEPARVRTLLEDAGYHDVDLTPIDEPLDLGKDAADAYAFAETMGMFEGLTHDLEGDTLAGATAALRGALERSETPDGVLLGSGAWLITATRP